MKFYSTTDLSTSYYADAIDIRREVFVGEQQIDESIEIDEFEESALHIVGYEGDQACCTARLLVKEDNAVKIQRVAVAQAFRNKGLGQILLQEIEQIALETLGANKLLLDAQDQAIPFYEKSGFIVYGDLFMDATIPHHHMKKTL